MTPTRRTSALGTAAALIAGGVLVAGSVFAAARSDAADAPAGTQVVLETTDAQSIRLDVGDQDASTGDRLVFSYALVRDGEPAGISGVECVVTSLARGPKPADGKGQRPQLATSHCLASLDLTEGRIAAQGLTPLADPGGPFELTITGGTGAYAGAVGAVRSEPGEGGNGRLVLTLAAR